MIPNTYVMTNKFIANGSHGKIVEIQDKIGIKYACKILPRNIGNAENEALIHQRLTGSPGIVSFYDFFQDDENSYIVMELLSDGNLMKNPLKSPANQNILKILRSVYYCHINDIVHLDIKPSNLMLYNNDSLLKLIDFGSAHYLKNGFETKDLQRTPFYMPPEALRSEAFKQSDIWSIGVVAYELITGRMPFTDREYPNNARLSYVLNSIMYDEPDYGLKGIDEKSEDFIRKCLQKEHYNRPSVNELIYHPWLN